MTRPVLLVAAAAILTCALALGIASQPTLLHALLRGMSALWRCL